MTPTHKKRIAVLLATTQKDKRYAFVRGVMREHENAEIFLVGGAVRDALLGRETKDFDFVVRGVSKTALEKNLRSYGTVHLVGKKFGVFKLNPKGIKEYEEIDIALPRTESPIAGTGHYRDFAIKTDASLPIETDLARRDLTINAIALNCVTGELVDPFGGVGDIKDKTIRAVGKPSERFAEDYSRTLRAIRCAIQFGFDIDAATWSSLKKSVIHLLDDVVTVEGEVHHAVAYEVISREFVRALMADPVRALDMLDEAGVIKILAPELLVMKGCMQHPEWHSEGDVWTHARLALSLFNSPEYKKEFGAEKPSPLNVVATLFHDVGKPFSMQTPEKDGVEHVKFYGHDRVGAEIAKRVADRIILVSAGDYSVDPDDLYWLIDRHLVLLNGDVQDMKNRTIEKYFFDDPARGDALRKLMFVDGLASVRADGSSSLDKFYELKVRMKKLTQLAGSKKTLPPALIDGYDVMKVAGISGGRRVGELIESLREEQLAGRVKTKVQARNYLKKLIT